MQSKTPSNHQTNRLSNGNKSSISHHQSNHHYHQTDQSPPNHHSIKKHHHKLNGNNHFNNHLNNHLNNHPRNPHQQQHNNLHNPSNHQQINQHNNGNFILLSNQAMPQHHQFLGTPMISPYHLNFNNLQTAASTRLHPSHHHQTPPTVQLPYLNLAYHQPNAIAAHQISHSTAVSMTQQPHSVSYAIPVNTTLPHSSRQVTNNKNVSVYLSTFLL